MILLVYNGGYHVSCYGEDDGMLYVVGGGTDHLPLTYQWYGPNGFSSTNDSILDLSIWNLFCDYFRHE